MANSDSRGLLDLRKLDLGELARQHNLPWAKPFVEMPSQERLALGHLSMLAGLEHTEDGKRVVRKVEIYNGLVRAERAALLFDEYLERRARPNRRRDEQDPLDQRHFTKDFNGWVNYLCWLDKDLDRALTLGKGEPFLEESRDRHKHTLITGSTGSGKSELIKLLVHHSVKFPHCGAVVVLDPHAKMVQEIARWKEFRGAGSERLVYLDAEALPEMDGAVPALNPLVQENLSENEKFAVAQQIGHALAFIAGDLTENMKNLAMFGARVLIDLPNSSLDEFKSSLWGEKKEIIASRFYIHGSQHPSKQVRDFFKSLFFSENYTASRQGLQSRLTSAFFIPTLEQMLIAPSPLNLREQIEAGKIILINLAPAGDEGRVILGRLLMAQIAALGRRRLANPKMKKAPVHVVVDEATLMMSKPMFSILTELRKENVWLTLSQQSIGDNADADLVRAIRENTNLKFIGRSNSMGQVFKALGWGSKDTPHIGDHEFIVNVQGSQSLMKLKTDDKLVDKSSSMTEQEFEVLVKGQISKYYWKPDQLPESTPESPARPDTKPESYWKEE